MDRVAPPNHPMYNFSSPERIGPGLWMMFMVMAANNKDEASRHWVCVQIRSAIDHMNCAECVGHARDYVRSNPPERHTRTERDLFDWVVRFLNSVNKRQGKPLYDKNILWRRFAEKGSPICTSNCGGTRMESSQPTYYRGRVVNRPSNFGVTRFQMN